MANVFIREARDGGDRGIWASYELAQNRLRLSSISSYLYNDAGTLKLSTGRIGLDNDSQKGACLIDTITTISLASISNSNWGKIEITNNGTGIVLSAADISGATDETTLPAAFTGAYDGEKGGYYIDATKRCIGLVWKNAGGTLEGIVNCLSGSSYIGYSTSDDADDNIYQFANFGNYEPLKKHEDKKEITSDETVAIRNNIENQTLICKTNDLIVNLPALSSIDNLRLRIFNAESDMITIKPNGAETINGLSYLFSKLEGDVIDLEKIDNKWRVINGWKPYFYSGYIRRSDWTDVHVGLGVVNYNNLVGTFRIGEKVVEAVSGNYGWIIYDSGTALTLVFIVEDGNGFTNASALTGQISTATATVNGNTKNVDSNIRHGWGKNQKKVLSIFHISTDGTETNNKKSVYPAPYRSSNVDCGLEMQEVDTNNVLLQSGTVGLGWIFNAAGLGTFIDTEDYYSNVYTELLRW